MTCCCAWRISLQHSLLRQVSPVQLVIDGAAIVQILKRGGVKTFQEYAFEVTYQESYETCHALMWYGTATKSIL